MLEDMLKISRMTVDSNLRVYFSMARIPNEELDRLKREVSLVRLVEASGVR